MSPRLWFALLVLAGCAENAPGGGDDQPESCPQPRPGCPSEDACARGQCLDIPVYACDEVTGTWVDTGAICEGVYVSVEGDLHLEQGWWAGEACLALVPRSPIAMSVQDDGTVIAAPPITILDGHGYDGWESGWIDVTLDDDWGGEAAHLVYGLTVETNASNGFAFVHGLAHVTATGCDVDLQVNGTLCPAGAEPCVTADDGWNLQCWHGAVYVDDLTRTTYCMPGTTDAVCELGGPGNASMVHACGGACVDGDVHWLETVDEYLAFDPASLCAP